jgi:glycosyltransferase involved in cell wall biosynthesis
MAKLMRSGAACDSILGMRKPSIMFINRVLPPHRGATGRRLLELSRALAEAGCAVTILACGPEPSSTPGAEPSRIPGVEVVRVGGAEPRGTLGYAAAWARLAARALLAGRHDVVVTMTDPPFLALLGPIVARLRRCRAVHWCHDLYPDLLPVLGLSPPAPVHRLLARLMARSVRRHDAVVAVGRCMARRLAAGGVDRARIAVVPNWPDPAIRPDPEGARALRRELGIEDRFVVGYAGTFGLAHPLGAVAEAAARLQASGLPVHFLLSGEGRGRPALEAEFGRRGLRNVTLLPWQPDGRLAALLGAADLHLAAMREEASGMMVPCKVAGVLAAGRPCLLLGPRDSDAAAAVRAAGGAVLRPGDGAALAEAILARAAPARSGPRPGPRPAAPEDRAPSAPVPGTRGPGSPPGAPEAARVFRELAFGGRAWLGA